MKVGDTFIWFLSGKKEHLYVALTDPDKNEGKFAVFNLTDSVHGTMSFTLHKGDHPYINKDSDVDFGDSFIMSIEKYETAVRWGQAIPREPMDMKIVAKIAEIIMAGHPAPSGDVTNLVKSQWRK